MMLIGFNGYYDDTGHWQRTKFCFMYCGDGRCDCGPPNGEWYSPAQDKRKSRFPDNVTLQSQIESDPDDDPSVP